MQRNISIVNNCYLGFANKEEELIIPKKLFFDDFCCVTSKAHIDISGWLVSDEIFSLLKSSCPRVQTLILSECKGFTSSDLEGLRGGLHNVHTFSMRSTTSASINLAKLFGSWNSLRYSLSCLEACTICLKCIISYVRQ